MNTSFCALSGSKNPSYGHPSYGQTTTLSHISSCQTPSPEIKAARLGSFPSRIVVDLAYYLVQKTQSKSSTLFFVTST